MSSVSSLGLQLVMTGGLQNEQQTLGNLSQEIASGQQYDNLTDYTPTQALQLLNFQNGVTQNQAYLSTIQTVQERLTVYNSTMGDMENIASQASSLASQAENYDPTSAANIQAQAQNYLLQVADDLNQQVNGRYIYAGARYTTQPVTEDQTVLNGTAQSIITDNTTLPDYDAQKVNDNVTSNPNAYNADTALIDNNYSVTYGVTSDNPAFQQLVNGLRYINAAVTAGQNGDTATYTSDIQQGTTMLNQALSNIQALNANVADNQNILTNQTTNQNNDITTLQNEIDNISQVNMTQVGTEINLLQTQLQASYAATASLEQLSLVKYL